MGWGEGAAATCCNGLLSLGHQSGTPVNLTFMDDAAVISAVHGSIERPHNKSTTCNPTILRLQSL